MSQICTTKIPGRVKVALQNTEDKDNLVVIKKWYSSLSHREKAQLDKSLKDQVKDLFGWPK